MKAPTTTPRPRSGLPFVVDHVGPHGGVRRTDYFVAPSHLKNWEDGCVFGAEAFQCFVQAMRREEVGGIGILILAEAGRVESENRCPPSAAGGAAWQFLHMVDKMLHGFSPAVNDGWMVKELKQAQDIAAHYRKIRSELALIRAATRKANAAARAQAAVPAQPAPRAKSRRAVAEAVA